MNGLQNWQVVLLSKHSLVVLLEKNSLITALFMVGAILWVASFISRKLTRGRIHASAIAIFMGLALAYLGNRQGKHRRHQTGSGVCAHQSNHGQD